MLILISVLLVILILTLFYMIAVINNGFITTNANVTLQTKKAEVLISLGDKIMGKYNLLTRDIVEQMK